MFGGIASRRTLPLAIGAIVLLSTLALTDAVSASTCGRDDRLETLAVRYSVPRDVYRFGETVVATVRVTRTVDRRDLGPAEGITVAIVLGNRARISVGSAVTDEDGEAVVRVKLEDHLRAGAVDAYGTAESELTGCPRVAEWGERLEEDFITVLVRRR